MLYLACEQDGTCTYCLLCTVIRDTSVFCDTNGPTICMAASMVCGSILFPEKNRLFRSCDEARKDESRASRDRENRKSKSIWSQDMRSSNSRAVLAHCCVIVPGGSKAK